MSTTPCESDKNMQCVNIDLSERSYPILIGNELLKDSTLLSPHLGNKVMIVTNEVVAPLYLDQALAAVGNTPASSVVLPDGESFKTLDTMDRIFEALLQQGFDRGCTLMALGGGVIGDMTGFAAASYQRGVDFVQVPTTLLAQVDSSVGGKTGVNHPLGKNMIGAFHQPKAVLADMSTLASLPDRELRAGLAEVIKYGFIVDEAFFEWLDQNMTALLNRDPQALAFAVRRSCEIKARVVEADEREHGMRALLNLGHTFGHAIEAAMGYGVWLHGEAISAGTVMALDLSRRLGSIDQRTVDRGIDLLARAGLPVEPPAQMSVESFLNYMMRDKKVSDGTLKLILLQGIGQAVASTEFDHDLFRQTLSHFAGSANSSTV